MHDETLLRIENAGRVFGGGRTLLGKPKRGVHAVQDVSIEVRRGETLGVVGESGCGKSTLARMIVGLDRPTAGRIIFEGRDLVAEAGRDLRRLSREVQYVFQDPVASLNPRKTVRTILEAPLIHLLELGREERTARLAELMDAVNLAPEFLDRYPHEFSGGQAQRIGIARALAADPKLIVLDEPVSALDVSVQAQVLNILDGLKQRFGLTYVFISHDLVGRRKRQRPRRGDVFRPYRRDRVGPRGVRQAAPSLHASAAQFRAGAGPQVAGGRGCGDRTARPLRPAARLLLLCPLPEAIRHV